ncbi:hypothetical protein [Erwinia sp. MYb416]|uniref:hypothetical protein n=1 Tax=Erwinia sp. MYb416 TaxID=3108532 RepID=UPI0030A951E7
MLASDAYPSFCRFNIKSIDNFDIKYPLIYSSLVNELWREVNYLRDQGLLIMDTRCSSANDIEGVVGYIKATTKGIDFIQDDGGLSAILNVQTIKFHRDAVVVLEDLIAISGMNDTEKEKAKSKLSELTTESLKTVVQTVTAAGLAVLMK